MAQMMRALTHRPTSLASTSRQSFQEDGLRIARTQRRGRPGISPVFPVYGCRKALHPPAPGPLTNEFQAAQGRCQGVPNEPLPTVA